MKVSRELRDLVVRRAQDACEYCRLPQIASLVPHQVDHIIGKQHRGSDDAVNLCLCCVRYNLNKGPNIASIDPETGVLVALYHPRINAWREHFACHDEWRHQWADGGGARNGPDPRNERGRPSPTTSAPHASREALVTRESPLLPNGQPFGSFEATRLTFLI